MHEHQAYDGQVARCAKARPEARHFVDRERNDGELGFPYTQSAEIEPGAAEAQRSAMQVDLVEAGGGLTGSIGELVTDGAIGTSHAVVDGGRRRRRLLARLETDVVEQGRIGKVCLEDVAGVMNALPPAHEVQQAVRIAVETLVGKSPDILTVQIAVDPGDASAGRLLDHLIRAVCARWGLLLDDAKVHGRAASKRDWNCCASPP